MGFKEAGRGGADWIHLTAGRIPVPGYCGYCNVFCDQQKVFSAPEKGLLHAATHFLFWCQLKIIVRAGNELSVPCDGQPTGDEISVEDPSRGTTLFVQTKLLVDKLVL